MDNLSRKIKIVSMGSYIPHNKITSEELDQKFNKPKGFFESLTGVKCRTYAVDETASNMGAKAATKALEAVKLNIDDIDCIVSTSGSMEQAIPCNAMLI